MELTLAIDTLTKRRDTVAAELASIELALLALSAKFEPELATLDAAHAETAAMKDQLQVREAELAAARTDFGRAARERDVARGQITELEGENERLRLERDELHARVVQKAGPAPLEHEGRP